MKPREKTFEVLNEMRYILRDLSEMADTLTPSKDFTILKKEIKNLRIGIEQKLRAEISTKSSVAAYQKATLNLNTSLTKPERVAEDLNNILPRVKNEVARYRLWCFISVLQLEANKPLIHNLDQEKARIYTFCLSLLKLPVSKLQDHISTDMIEYRFNNIFKSKVLQRDYQLPRTIL